MRLRGGWFEALQKLTSTEKLCLSEWWVLPRQSRTRHGHTGHSRFFMVAAENWTSRDSSETI